MDYTNIVSDNVSLAKEHDSSICPQSYYNMRFGNSEVCIIRDRVFVHNTRPRRSKYYYYHIVCSGFAVNWYDDNYIKVDKLNRFKRIRYGNFLNLSDALYDFKRLCCTAFNGYFVSSICKHYDSENCICDFSLFGNS